MIRFLIPAVVVVLLLPTSVVEAAERVKIYDDRNRQIGDVYCPGYGRRCQVRDNDRRIKYYLEKDGTITDTRRRKIGEVEDLLKE